MRAAELLGRHRALVAVALITVLAGALRFATLGVQSVWLDESLTILHVNKSFGAMLSEVARHENTPPLYFVLVWAWTHIFGHSAFAFRSLSALLGTLTVPLLYLAGSRFSTAAGVWAAGLGAISAEMFYYSQEARAYALFILLSLAAFVAWQRALDEPRARTLALWSSLSILALLTHYFAAFLLLAEVSVLIWRLGWRRLVAPVGACALGAAALAPLVVHQTSSSPLNWIAQTSRLGRLAEAPKEFVAGPYGPLGLILAPAAALLVTGTLVRLVRTRKRQHRQALLEVAIVGVAAIGLPALLAVTGIEDVFDGRNVTAAWPVLAVLAAVGLAAGRPRFGVWLGIGLCAISAGVIIGTLALPAYQRDDWWAAARSLPAPAPGGRVLISERYGTATFSIYLPDIRPLSRDSRSVDTRELDFVFLRRVHGGAWEPGEDSLFAPIAPSSPVLDPPAPFRLVAVRRTAAYATYRFLAPVAMPVTVGWLRRAFGDRNADVAVQG